MYTELINHLPTIEVVCDSALDNQKQGRPFLILYNSELEKLRAEKLYDSLAQKTRTVLIRLSEITENNWQDLTGQLLATYSSLGLKQASLVSFGAVGAIVQNLALVSPKSVRAMVLVDAATRPNPSAFQRIIDTVEQWLPMGLPFRSDVSGFDSRPFAQRLRAPVLVISTERSTPYLRAQASLLTQRLPTSWFFELSGDNAQDKLCELVLQFEEVPAKCPQ